MIVVNVCCTYNRGNMARKFHVLRSRRQQWSRFLIDSTVTCLGFQQMQMHKRRQTRHCRMQFLYLTLTRYDHYILHRRVCLLRSLRTPSMDCGYSLAVNMPHLSTTKHVAISSEPVLNCSCRPGWIPKTRARSPLIFTACSISLRSNFRNRKLIMCIATATTEALPPKFGSAMEGTEGPSKCTDVRIEYTQFLIC